MPTETLKISPVATETPPRKNVKERLGTRVRGVAAPYVPMSTVMGEEEGQDEEGGQQGEICYSFSLVCVACCIMSELVRHRQVKRIEIKHMYKIIYCIWTTNYNEIQVHKPQILMIKTTSHSLLLSIKPDLVGELT